MWGEKILEKEKGKHYATLNTLNFWSPENNHVKASISAENKAGWLWTQTKNKQEVLQWVNLEVNVTMMINWF